MREEDLSAALSLSLESRDVSTHLLLLASRRQKKNVYLSNAGVKKSARSLGNRGEGDENYCCVLHHPRMQLQPEREP